MEMQKEAWSPYLKRYRAGEWRSPIFRDMIVDDALRLQRERGKLALLDIGCGGGFDSDRHLQHSLAHLAGQYIGIEPDENIELADIFSTTHRCFFEDAPIEPESIDIAFAVMVLEHFSEPQVFWDKLHRILKPDGVFWGFTVDARHWFASASRLAGKLYLKDLYLNLLHGTPGQERYENYDVYYRTNTPEQIENLAGAFASKTVLNFYRPGQTNYYFPKPVQWLGTLVDTVAIRLGLPGSIMAVRVMK